jgi:hypothetical protein
MKKLLVIGLILLFPTVCFAAPFIVCDPQTGVTTYQLTGPVWVPTSINALTDGSLRLDVSPSAVGSTTIGVKACKVDAVWGTLCSTEVPFTYTRPVAPTTPGNTKLVP